MESAADAVIAIDLADEAATHALATTLADAVVEATPPNLVIALWGDLGVGKSVFARAFINALPGETEEVPSPTFTLLQTYDRDDTPVHHFDLYRIEDAEECIELGIEDAFADGISLIEWPDRLGTLLPRERLDVTISLGKGETDRRATLSGAGGMALRLIGRIVPGYKDD